jgi:hypothetical protein
MKAAEPWCLSFIGTGQKKRLALLKAPKGTPHRKVTVADG